MNYGYTKCLRHIIQLKVYISAKKHSKVKSANLRKSNATKDVGKNSFSTYWVKLQYRHTNNEMCDKRLISAIFNWPLKLLYGEQR